MTDDQLDLARAVEAQRIIEARGGLGPQPARVAAEAARLAREGWMPPEPVDPVVRLAREVVARIWREDDPAYIDALKAGDRDDWPHMIIAVAGIHAGISMARRMDTDSSARPKEGRFKP